MTAAATWRMRTLLKHNLLSLLGILVVGIALAQWLEATALPSNNGHP